MFNNNLMNYNSGISGIYRAKLIIEDSDIRVYVPSLHSINPFDENGVLKSDYNKYMFPQALWCAYNLESIDPANQVGPAWVMFENGNIIRPVILSYTVIGGGNSSSTNGNNQDDYSTDSPIQTVITIDGDTKYYNGLIRCINGTDAGYVGDEGLDVGAPIGTPVYAPCDGTIRYSEFGHTPWGQTKWGPNRDDTCYSIGIDMSKSVSYAGKTISYIFLTHLSKLIYNVPSGSGGRAVKAGELIAYSGTANGSPHLHIGLSPSSWNPLTMQQTRDFFASSLGETWVVGK